MVRVKRDIGLAGVYEVRPEHASLKAFTSRLGPILARLTQCDIRGKTTRKKGTRQIEKIRGGRF